jgi:hypothetical protein
MKKIKFFSLLLTMIIISCSHSYQPKRSEKLYNALTDKSIEIRGKIIDNPKSEYRYDYYDIDEKDSCLKELTEKGYHGGGPSWVGIVYGAIRMSDDKLLSKTRFDEEADGLAMWSYDRESLEKIGRLIAVIKTDKKILNECILVAEKNGQME